MRIGELKAIRRKWLDSHLPYKMTYWKDFNYETLSNVMYKKRAGRGSNKSYNDCFIMLDTETSKKNPNVVGENHVVAWTISIRALDRNIVTLWGHRPDTAIECLLKVHDSMAGENTFVYVHNLSYDWVFLRKFILVKMGTPTKQLNTKPHYPIYIEFANGIIFRDSLILAQRKLEKWAEDMAVEHKKSVGKWDYDKIRSQKEKYTADELEYIEHDTLAGVECLDKLMNTLGKHVYSMPYTATGIIREAVRTIGKEYNAHERFQKMALEFENQQIMEQVYHGGYTHANRHFIGRVMQGTTCRDFASSYPYTILSEKFPMEKFTPWEDCTGDFILENLEEYAFYFKFIATKIRLDNDFIPMPALQFSKCVKVINPVLDNGRILAAGYVEIWLTSEDLPIILSQYKFESHICHNVMYSAKRYLPRWLTDYVFQLFTEKTKLKGGDPVAYALAKSRINSVYGLFVQKPCKPEITECYADGEYITEDTDLEEVYNKYVNSINTVLPYFWGVWVTAYAFRNLFALGACVDYENGGEWVYSDTDSCYATKWNEQALEAYNAKCKEKLIANGYGAVEHNGREYWLGVAEPDAEYTKEFVTLGAKRYCGRSDEDGELHITVAGVPKKGAKCLQDDINNFKVGMVFNGNVTGKKTHSYFFVDEIYTDANGNITGDSIDLSPCDYLLDDVDAVDWERIYKEEIEVQVYGES